MQSGPALHGCGSMTYCTHGKGVLICSAREAHDGSCAGCYATSQSCKQHVSDECLSTGPCTELP